MSLDPAVGSARRGTRPCLVLSGSRFNALPIQRAMVVPLTTRDHGLPHHIEVRDDGIEVRDDGGLERPSWAMCEAARIVSTRRFGKMIGVAAPVTVVAVARQLTNWISDS